MESVHHINGDRNDNRPVNTIQICRSCGTGDPKRNVAITNHNGALCQWCKEVSVLIFSSRLRVGEKLRLYERMSEVIQSLIDSGVMRRTGNAVPPIDGVPAVFTHLWDEGGTTDEPAV